MGMARLTQASFETTKHAVEKRLLKAQCQVGLCQQQAGVQHHSLPFLTLKELMILLNRAQYS